MMVRTFSLILLLSAGVLSAQEGPWTTYASNEGKCEIRFPGKVKVKTEKTGTQVLLEAMGGKAVYMFQFTATANEIAVEKEETVKKVFDSARDGLVKKFKGGKVRKETDLQFAGYPARDIDLEAPEIGIYRLRLILSPQFLYQVTAAGPKEFVDGADVQKFRESLKLMKK